MTQSYMCTKRGGWRCRRGFLNFIDHFSRHIVNVLLISAFLPHLDTRAWQAHSSVSLWHRNVEITVSTYRLLSNLCSNPVASYKTLWIISVTFPLTVGVYWCWTYICCLFLSLYRWLSLCPALSLPVDPHQPAAVPVAAALCWSGSQDTATWTPGEGSEPRLPLLLHLCAQHAGKVSLYNSPLLLLKMI